MSVVIRYHFKSANVEESDILGVLPGNDLEDGRHDAELYAANRAARYSCRYRRWGKNSWRVWEPGEDGLDMWIRVTLEDDE